MSFQEFSFKSREQSLRRFREETFDLLIIGGGITGAAAARDAAARGLKVALVEKGDFASGTSSRSSKLIHGGLRYLENFEFGLVFEALAERSLLLKTAPHMVRPLPFFLPVYQDDPHGRFKLNLGLWLYDLLALFRTPGFHRNLSRDQILQAIPFLRQEGLQGGLRYYDASMWDDVLVIETLRAAHGSGAAIANYVEAVGPYWAGERITGFRLRDREQPAGRGEIDIKARRTVICAGPWTDLVGSTLSSRWKNWLKPSKGVHLIFPLSKLPIPGAMVMSHPSDGRISFVIPRPDFGAGVVIVGTTDSPITGDPGSVEVEKSDVDYLMALLSRYFPELGLSTEDIISAYVGVRPLTGAIEGEENASLQKISREHTIGPGPGGTLLVAGGKYTTHRRMGEEIVDAVLSSWREDVRLGRADGMPSPLLAAKTESPVNPKALASAVAMAQARAKAAGLEIPKELFERYGAEAMDVVEIQSSSPLASIRRAGVSDPEGFPLLEAQLRYNLRTGMVLHLEDFYFRRVPLYAARADHGAPWVDSLARVWAEERGMGAEQTEAEIKRLQDVIAAHSAWKDRLSSGTRQKI